MGKKSALDVDLDIDLEAAQEDLLARPSRPNFFEKLWQYNSKADLELFLYASKTALDNPLILKTILENLGSLDLLTLRLVSTVWRDLATEILIRRTDLTVKLFYDQYTATFRQRHMPKTEETTLTSLTNLTQSTLSNFPCSSFSIIYGELGHEELQHFLDTYGQKIRAIDLRHFSLVENKNISPKKQEDNENNDVTLPVTPDLSLFKKLLVDQCPNLHTLYLEISQFSEPSLIWSEVNLPNLTILGVRDVENSSLPCLTHFLKEVILNMAKNLQTVHFTHPHTDLDLLTWFHDLPPKSGPGSGPSQGDRLDLIQSFQFPSTIHPHDLTEMTDLIPKIYRLRLRHLTIQSADLMMTNSFQHPEEFKVVKKFLKRVLKLSQFSLKKLTIEDTKINDLIPGVTWPPNGLPNVRKLELNGMSKKAKIKLSWEYQEKGAKFLANQNLPNLWQVDIDHELWWRRDLPKLVPSSFSLENLRLAPITYFDRNFQGDTRGAFFKVSRACLCPCLGARAKKVQVFLCKSVVLILVISLVLLGLYSVTYGTTRRRGNEVRSSGPICTSTCTYSEIEAFFHNTAKTVKNVTTVRLKDSTYEKN